LPRGKYLARRMADTRSNFRVWFDQAWAEWIQPLGAIVLAGVAYLLYKNDLLSERVTGGALVLLVVVGILLMGVLPAIKLTRRPSQRAMMLMMCVCALAGAGWPTLRMVIASQPLATARFSANNLSATVQTGTDGPYEVVVSGHFKTAGASDVEAGYSLKLEGQGSESVSGSLHRALHRYRTGRRGGTSTSVEEHTEAMHRVDGVRGSTLKITLDGVDEQLDGNLEISVRRAGPRPEVFWALCVLSILLALVLDARLVQDIKEEDRKVRGPKRELSYLTVVTSMLFVFAINFPMEATPRSLVRAAIGAFFLALLAGGAAGWLLAAFVRLATKPKRRA
jgi:hypothetical protein